MTENTEAWFRKPRRIIHNQKLIQTVLTLAFLVPMPVAAGSMWLIANSPAIVIQTAFFTWLIAALAYLGLISYVRVKN
jgi:membrane protein YdbS with pleckstrin-like domain